jgi:Nucleoporin autopeptidase
MKLVRVVFNFCAPLSKLIFAVHIRHREVVVYPNDDAKPPLGQGLNRRAQVTLDRIYPTNKQTRAPIKDVDTIINMDYDTTLRKACYKMEARFIEYIPESGSWVFKVMIMIMRAIVLVGRLFSELESCLFLSGHESNELKLLLTSSLVSNNANLC